MKLLDYYFANFGSCITKHDDSETKGINATFGSMEKPGEYVKFTRNTSPPSFVHTVSEDQHNVVLLLDNHVQKSSHICYLSSSSPVLREILHNIEVRLEQMVTICLPGYSSETVTDLLKFVHHGSVVFTSKEGQLAFLSLCQSLKINPPVRKEFVIQDDELLEAMEERLQETNLEPDESKDSENSEALDTAPSPNNDKGSEKSCNEPEEKVQAITAASEQSPNPDVIQNKIESLCDKENNFLLNLKSPGGNSSQQPEEDEETPELISDFLRDLEKMSDTRAHDGSKANAEIKSSNVDDYPELPTTLVTETEDAFKMPDSFDLPTEFIQEILPTKKAILQATTSMKETEPPRKIESSAANMSSHVHHSEKKVLEVKSTKDSLKDLKSSSLLQAKPSSSKEQEAKKKAPESSSYQKPQSSKSNLSKEPFKKKHNFDVLKEAKAANKPDALIPITYAKDSSKRNQGIQGKINPLRDRRKFMASVFGSESEEEESEEESRSKVESSPNLANELEEKKRRMQEKLESKRKRKVSKKNGPREGLKRNEEDEDFIVSDNEELYEKSSTEATEPDLSDSSSDDDDGRRKRLKIRKKKKGGDVLSWMSRRAKVSVTVQTAPKDYIQDMAQYRLKLLGDEDSGESSNESKDTKSKSRNRNYTGSGSSTDECVTKRRRIRTMDSSSESEVESKRHKLKKRKKLKVETPSKASFPVEEVIWTPSMYQKWDKMSNKPLKEKSKSFNRSTSAEFKSAKSVKIASSDKFKRSISSIDSSKGKVTMHPSTSSSTLPKIPKLVKKD